MYTLPMLFYAFLSFFEVTISFGQLEQVITGLAQVAIVIGIIIFIAVVLLSFFPAGRKFLGGLGGMFG